jgi:reactive intermediate/imine deaminase
MNQATRIVETTAAPQPSGTYSQAVVAPPFVFLAGQGPFEPKSRTLVAGDTETQLRAVMANLEAVARAAGGSLADAVRFGVYLRDLDDMPVVNRIFEELLMPPYPARTTIQSSLTRFDVEVDAVLYLPPNP